MSYTAPNGTTHELKLAMPDPVMLTRRLKNGIYVYTDLNELEKRCSKCKECWPADSEFFFAAKDDDGLSAWCKACYKDWRYPNGRSKPVPIAPVPDPVEEAEYD